MPETVELVPPSEPLSKSEYIDEFSITEVKAIAFIFKRRKPKPIAKPKTSFSNRIEFKVDESEKRIIDEYCQAKGD